MKTNITIWIVIPAMLRLTLSMVSDSRTKAGIQVVNLFLKNLFKNWIPAFAGMTVLIICPLLILQAKGPGTTAGLVLLRTSAPRPSALGGAFTAALDDIAALPFNPASLATMQSAQLSFQRQQGVFDDAFSHLMFGSRLPVGSFGFSAGLYDSGEAKLWDGVSSEKTVTAQKDLLLDFGYGFHLNKIAVGGDVKYLSSTLAEQTNGSAMAMNVGVNVPLGSRFCAGAAATLYSSKIAYGNQEEALPKVYRAGLSYESNLDLENLPRLPVLLLLDFPLSTAGQEVSPTLGLETRAGLMALRMGYKTNQSLEGFSIGAGLFVKNLTFDYAFGFVDQNNLNSVHNLSVSMRFKNGLVSKSTPQLVQANKNQ